MRPTAQSTAFHDQRGLTTTRDCTLQNSLTPSMKRAPPEFENENHVHEKKRKCSGLQEAKFASGVSWSRNDSTTNSMNRLGGLTCLNRDDPLKTPDTGVVHDLEEQEVARFLIELVRRILPKPSSAVALAAPLRFSPHDPKHSSHSEQQKMYRHKRKHWERIEDGQNLEGEKHSVFQKDGGNNKSKVTPGRIGDYQNGWGDSEYRKICSDHEDIEISNTEGATRVYKYNEQTDCSECKGGNCEEIVEVKNTAPRADTNDRFARRKEKDDDVGVAAHDLLRDDVESAQIQLKIQPEMDVATFRCQSNEESQGKENRVTKKKMEVSTVSCENDRDRVVEQDLQCRKIDSVEMIGLLFGQDDEKVAGNDSERSHEVQLDDRSEEKVAGKDLRIDSEQRAEVQLAHKCEYQADRFVSEEKHDKRVKSAVDVVKTLVVCGNAEDSAPAEVEGKEFQVGKPDAKDDHSTKYAPEPRDGQKCGGSKGCCAGRKDDDSPVELDPVSVVKTLVARPDAEDGAPAEVDGLEFQDEKMDAKTDLATKFAPEPCSGHERVDCEGCCLDKNDDDCDVELEPVEKHRERKVEQNIDDLRNKARGNSEVKGKSSAVEQREKHEKQGAYQQTDEGESERKSQTATTASREAGRKGGDHSIEDDVTSVSGAEGCEKVNDSITKIVPWANRCGDEDKYRRKRNSRGGKDLVGVTRSPPDGLDLCDDRGSSIINRDLLRKPLSQEDPDGLLLDMIGSIRSMLDCSGMLEVEAGYNPDFVQTMDDGKFTDLTDRKSLIGNGTISTYEQLEVCLRRMTPRAKKYSADVENAARFSIRVKDVDPLRFMDRIFRAWYAKQVMQRTNRQRRDMALNIKPYQWCIFRSPTRDHQGPWLGRAIPKGGKKWGGLCAWKNTTKKSRQIDDLFVGPGGVAINIQWYERVKPSRKNRRGRNRSSILYGVSKNNPRPVAQFDDSLILVGEAFMNQVCGPSACNSQLHSRTRGSDKKKVNFDRWFEEELEFVYSMHRFVYNAVK